jgi:lysophospholipase L1-like esterase
MKRIIRHLIFLPLFWHLGCSSTASVSNGQQVKLSGRELKPVGRYDIADTRLELISSAVHFGVEFEGTELTLVASANAAQHGYLQYELDGVYQKRLRVDGSHSEVKILTPPGKHVVWIFKATEAHSGPVYIHEVIANKLRSINTPALPLIEFIGNSITCGAAADPSEVPCGTGVYHDQHNAYMAYGPRIARALKADYILSSVSGIGIYRNWNSDGPVMPQVYEKTDLAGESLRVWNFSHSPAIVSIALGTNDFSNGDGKRPRLAFDSAAFTKNYVAFVRTVKSKYPKAKVVLLNSPMVSGARNDVFVDCLNRIKGRTDAAFPSDKPVSIFLFKPMKAGGCGGHPNVEDHGVMAEQLLEFYRSLIGK